MKFISLATFGSYLPSCPEVDLNSQEMNAYHKAFLTYSFLKTPESMNSEYFCGEIRKQIIAIITLITLATENHMLTFNHYLIFTVKISIPQNVQDCTQVFDFENHQLTWSDFYFYWNVQSSVSI